MYDLGKRTTALTEITISTLRNIQLTLYNKNAVEQLIRSISSIGANYQEANGGVSKNDFKSKIALCKKESMESEYWLTILYKLSPSSEDELKPIRAETHQLVLIFTKILQSCRSHE